jgi:NAD(P)-dependent dehydrogenase (short-subunit alcohol dehydrogenase family)
MGPSSLFSLDGKIGVVTGGLGFLGQQFSRELVRSGAKVAILDVSEWPAKNSKKQALEGFQNFIEEGRIRVFKADITRRAEIESSLRAISQDWGVPDILINNAAIDSPPDAPASENGPFEDYPENSLDKILEVNLKAPFLCCQVFGKAMAEAGRGSIINIASIYGLVSPVQDIYAYKRRDGSAWYKPATYSMTKAGVVMLTKYLATYWAKKGVRVNALTPAGIYNHQDKEFLEEYEKRMPMGRMAKPDELNGAVVFLASEASSYMTGSNLVVDGGWTAW